MYTVHHRVLVANMSTNLLGFPSKSPPKMTQSFISLVNQTVPSSDVFQKTFYFETNFVINEDSMVFEIAQ